MSDDRLPYGKQFSPKQVNLKVALELAAAHAGDRSGFEHAMRQAFFEDRGTSLENRKTLAYNACLSMRAYGLVSGGDAAQPFELTEVGASLLDASRDGSGHLTGFGEHIVTRLHGLQLLEVVDSLRARGGSITVPRVADDLLALGIDPGGRAGENINPMKMWLEQAGLLDRWEIQDAGLRFVLGTGMADITELVALSLRHRAFLLALATTCGTGPHSAADVRRLAELQTPDAIFDTKTFAKDVLEKLQKDGWVTYRKATGGRGAKSHLVTSSARFATIVREPLLRAAVEQTHLQDPVSLRRPISQLLTTVRDSSLTSHERGLALEGVCIQIVRLLGARFVDWRRRGDETAGAEVDVIAELVDGRYQLVQVQSKASRLGGRDVVDREVGVAATLKSNVILFVSAQEVSDAARRAAATHMQESGLAILFLDGDDLDGLNTGAEIATMIDREWRRVVGVRSAQSRHRAAGLKG